MVIGDSQWRGAPESSATEVVEKQTTPGHIRSAPLGRESDEAYHPHQHLTHFKPVILSHLCLDVNQCKHSLLYPLSAVTSFVLGLNCYLHNKLNHNSRQTRSNAVTWHQAIRVQAMPGWHLYLYDLVLGSPMRNSKLDSVILMGFFQLKISVILWFNLLPELTAFDLNVEVHWLSKSLKCAPERQYCAVLFVPSYEKLKVCHSVGFVM